MDWSLISSVLRPEIILLSGILLAIVASPFAGLKKWTQAVSVAALAAASIAAFQGFQAVSASESVSIFFDSFSHDAMSSFFRFLIYFISTLVVLAASAYLDELDSPAEYFPIIMTAALGAGFLTGVNDFLALFVSLETLGLAAILASSYARLNQGSNEAGIKYLITSAVATATMLLGISFVYGLTGATNFDIVHVSFFKLISLGIVSGPLLILIVTLIVGALAFKLAAAPFHNWSPDVYSGAPTTTTLFLSVVSKTAALGLALRLLIVPFHFQLGLITGLFAVIAVISIIVGNWVGLTQILNHGSVKRLLAYSSIAQAGYLLVALATFEISTLKSMVLYLTLYALMNSVAFLGAIQFENETGSDKIYDLAGYIQKRPLIAIFMSLGLISLAGLPLIPGGFIAKFFLFASAYTSAISFGKLLAVIGLIGSVPALFYYLYLVKIMVVDAPSNSVKVLEDKVPACIMKDTIKASLYIATAVMVYYGIFGMEVLKETSALVIAGLA